MLKKAEAEELEIVFYENNDKLHKSPTIKNVNQAGNLHSLPASQLIIKPMGKKNELRTINKEFNQVLEFVQEALLMELPSPSTGLTVNSSVNGINLSAAEDFDNNGNDQIKELIFGYLKKDRMLYNQINVSADTIPVPERISHKKVDISGYSEYMGRSLNEMLIESIEGNKSPEHKHPQKEVVQNSKTLHKMAENCQNRPNLDLFEIKEDPGSARSSIAKEKGNKENNVYHSNNLHHHHELDLDEVPEVLDAEYQGSEMNKSHKIPYLITEKKSSSRLWKQAFEQPSPISIKEVKFLKPSRSNEKDNLTRSISNPTSRDNSPILRSDRDGSFIISRPVIKDIPKPELQMDQSIRIVGKRAKNVYELSPISTQRKLGEIWSQDGVKSAESFYSPANISQMYDKKRKSGKSPNITNASTISINNRTGNTTNYSFRQNDLKLSNQNPEKKKTVVDASKRYILPVDRKVKVKEFVPHNEKERLKER